MKNKKTTLSDLKVQSFITSFSNKGRQTVKGGGASQLETGFCCPVYTDEPISQCKCK